MARKPGSVFSPSPLRLPCGSNPSSCLQTAMKYGWSKVVGCQNMSAPKCAPYVQRHDADLITRSSPTVPVDTFSGFEGHGVQGSRQGYMAAVRAIAKLTLPAGVPGTNFRVFQYKPLTGAHENGLVGRVWPGVSCAPAQSTARAADRCPLGAQPPARGEHL